MNSMKSLFVAIALFTAVITLSGCGQKAEQPQTAQAQTQPISDVADQYRQEIDGLAKVGFTVRTIEDGKNSFQIYKEDSVTFNAQVVDLEKRIKADTAIEGTETSGQKAELLKALKDSASKNAPFLRVVEMNKQTEQKLKIHMLATGQQSLREAAVQQTVSALKGTDSWLKLYEGDEGDFNQKVEEMFSG